MRSVNLSTPEAQSLVMDGRVIIVREAKSINDCFSPEFPCFEMDEIIVQEDGVVFRMQTRVDDTSDILFKPPLGGPGSHLIGKEKWRISGSSGWGGKTLSANIEYDAGMPPKSIPCDDASLRKWTPNNISGWMSSSSMPPIASRFPDIVVKEARLDREPGKPWNWVYQLER